MILIIIIANIYYYQLSINTSQLRLQLILLLVVMILVIGSIHARNIQCQHQFQPIFHSKRCLRVVSKDKETTAKSLPDSRTHNIQTGTNIGVSHVRGYYQSTKNLRLSPSLEPPTWKSYSSDSPILGLDFAGHHCLLKQEVWMLGSNSKNGQKRIHK